MDQPSLEPPERRWQLWFAAGVFALLLIGLTLLWARYAAPPPASALYPAETGTTRTYQVGQTGYRWDNLTLLRGNPALSALSAASQQQALTALFGPQRDLIKTYTARGAELVVVRLSQVELDQASAITRTNALLLSLPYGLDLVEVNGQSFGPPLPLVDTRLQVGSTRVTTGTIGADTPYTGTLTLLESVTQPTPLGERANCLKFEQQLNALPRSTAVYCPGVGLVAETTAGGPDARLIGVSAPGVTVVPAELPAATGPSATLAQAFPAALGDTLQTRWAYRDPTSGAHVTAPPLAVGALDGAGPALLLVGTQDGGMLAIDRRTHGLLWRFQAGGAVYGTPAVADGTVFFGAADRRVYALDLRSGGLRWSFAARDAISAAPRVSANTVYIGAEDRTIYALDAATGALRWQQTAGDAVAASAVVRDGTLYIGADDGALRALDAASGAVRWAYATGDAITAAAIVSGDSVLVGSNDGSVYALEAAPAEPTGAMRWSTALGAGVTADMALSADTLLAVDDDDVVHALDAASGAERWRYRSPRRLYGGPLVLGERVYVNQGTALLALDLNTGAALPAVPTGEPASYHSVSSDGRELFVGHRNGFLRVVGPPDDAPWQPDPLWTSDTLAVLAFQQSDSITTPPAADAQQLYFVGFTGKVYGVARSSGTAKLLGAVTLSDSALLPPVIAGEVLVLGTQRGEVAGFDVQTGKERWRAELKGSVRAAPAVTDGLVLLTVGGAQPIALALDAASGAERWRRDLPAGLPTSAAILSGGRYYVAAQRLTALDPASGATLWQAPAGARPYQLAADGERVFAVAYDADFVPLLLGYDQDGREIARQVLRLSTIPQTNGLTAGPDGLALALLDGTLLGLDPGGAERWRAQAVAPPTGPPLVVNGHVLQQLRDNRLVARRLSDGGLAGDFMLQAAGSTLDGSVAAPLLRDGIVYVGFGQYAAALTLKASR